MTAGNCFVLVVEDEPAHAEAIRRAFAKADPSTVVEVVGSLREYREAVAAHVPDVAIVDLNLPDGRAIEVLTSPTDAGPFPIVVMTSFGDEHTAVEAMRSGALDYVVKSPDAFALMPRVAGGALREWSLLQERKLTQEALARSLAMQEAIFEGSRDAIFISDADSRFVAVNAAASELTGYSAEELLSMRIPDLHEEADLHAYETHHDSIMAGTEVLSEAATRRKDGRKVDTEFSSRRIVVEGKALMHTTARDISVRKQAERDLEESEERYQSLARVSPVGIFRTDEKGATTYVNPSWSHLSGLTVEEALGDGWLRVVHPDDREGLIQSWRDSSQLARASFADYRLVRANGTVVWVMGQATPETNAEGEVVGYVGTITDITERKRAEEALQESEERYRQLVEMESDALLLIDNETGRILEANGAAAALYGFSREELLAKRNTDLSAQPEETQRVTHGTPVISDHVITVPLRVHRKKDGTEFPVEITGRFFTNRGRPVHIAAIRDITERKRAETALREAETRYRLLFEHSPDGIVVLDPRTARPLEFNEAAHRQLGYSREEFARLSIFDLEDSETPDETRSTIARVISAGRSDFETHQRAKDGGIRDVHVTAQVTEILGQPVYHCVWRDVTERRRADEALRESREMLRESQRIAGLGSYVLDIAAGRWAGSDVLDSVFGVDEAYDRSVEGWAALIHRDDRAMMVDYFANEVVGTGKTFDKEYRIVRPSDQAVRWVHGLGRLECDAQGRPLKMRGTIQDITERRRAEEALVHSRAQLLQSQKMEAVGRLAGGVAHDFNNILQAMLSLATVLRLRAGSSDLAKVVGDVESLIQRGAGLTQQLLLFARRQVAERRRLDLGELASAASVLLRRLIPENIRLIVDNAPERLWVDGDAGQLHQVLMNLAVNARDAMPGGGTLTIRSSGLVSEAVLEVIDTGHGMDEALRAHLFEPFFTTKETGKGTGLGLSVVHGIVEQHGGRIEVESAPGEGSRFRVILPAVSAPEATSKDPSGETELPRGNGERVLVVEDEEGARKGLAELLELLGYQVTAVGSGEEASMLPAEESPDVLLTDLMLPGLGGSELASDLKVRWPAMRAVLMSGYTEDEAVRRGVDDGSLRFLQKPFDMTALARELRSVLDRPR
ncbi:MAG: PAS domain S-box protein [Acidobacteria bacterium]|nr:PAS domain S-box protein [Acidobacteriota bacterium]